MPIFKKQKRDRYVDNLVAMTLKELRKYRNGEVQEQYSALRTAYDWLHRAILHMETTSEYTDGDTQPLHK